MTRRWRRSRPRRPTRARVRWSPVPAVFAGERCPSTTRTKGACGLVTDDPRHTCRAVLEGICFAVRSLLPPLPAERQRVPHPHALTALHEVAHAEASGSAFVRPRQGARVVLLPGARRRRGQLQRPATTLAAVLQREICVSHALSHVPASALPPSPLRSPKRVMAVRHVEAHQRAAPPRRLPQLLPDRRLRRITPMQTSSAHTTPRMNAFARCTRASVGHSVPGTAQRDDCGGPRYVARGLCDTHV